MTMLMAFTVLAVLAMPACGKLILMELYHA